MATNDNKTKVRAFKSSKFWKSSVVRKFWKSSVVRKFWPSLGHPRSSVQSPLAHTDTDSSSRPMGNPQSSVQSPLAHTDTDSSSRPMGNPQSSVQSPLGHTDTASSSRPMGDPQSSVQSPLGHTDTASSSRPMPQSSVQSPLGHTDTASSSRPMGDPQSSVQSPLAHTDTASSSRPMGDPQSSVQIPVGQTDTASSARATGSNIIGSSRSSRRVYKYDVFLSFRGTDTRNTFTDHLYNHLIRKGIFAFMDDKRLEQGEPIKTQLLQAITDSRVSIVVFSTDYASSTWCLEEMATIAECKIELGQTVFSIFYDVDPSHVRNQNGVYKEAFALHTEKFKKDPGKVDRWKRAMTCLANSVGWDVRFKPEFAQIGEIIQKVIKTLERKLSGSDDDLIGIQSRVEGLEKLLELTSEDDDDFRVLGICGMGGIGKTTHAKVLFDRVSYQFDGCCFVENVSQNYRDGGAIVIQKQIIRQSLNEQNLWIYSHFEISSILRNRLSRIKVLIILDNVDELEQLEGLAISPSSLGRGSRIIIVTRDEHILKVYGASKIHKVSLLNRDEAYELFMRKAFKKGDRPSSSSCAELTPKILEYAQNLPLAVKAVGSLLYSRDASQWRDALERMRRNPNKNVMDVLRISFEGLELMEKEIFLHIACFFHGEREDYVKQILDSCGLHPHIGIPIIKEKSLITITNQEIHMHEMLQELGKEIVRQKSPDEPGSWSRLWLYQDFHHVLTSTTGTNNVKAIVLDQKENVSRFGQLRIEGLSKMKGLKLLILYHQKFSGSLDFLSSNLQYILWHGYPFSSLPSHFDPYCLVELNLPDSRIKHLWESSKNFSCLERMDLSNSKDLMMIPNFALIPNLKWLDLSGCTNLVHINPSIGLLTKLAYLNLRNCSNLIDIDLGTECMLSSLTVLHLSGCTKLEKTPDFTGVPNLEHLDLEQCTSLSSVDESIGELGMLKFLSLRGCTSLVKMPTTVNDLTCLQTLNLRDCFELKNLPLMAAGKHLSSSCLHSLIFLDLGFCKLSIIPSAIGDLKFLERLNLQRNNIRCLPDSIGRLSNLSYLNLADCYELEEVIPIPMLPLDCSSSGGRYFRTVSASRNHRSGLYIFNCKVILTSYWTLAALQWLTRLVEQPCHFRCGFDIITPINGIDEIPKWYFNHQFEGGSTIRISDSEVGDDWLGLSFCLVFEVNKYRRKTTSSSSWQRPLYLSFESENTEEYFDAPTCLDLRVSKYCYCWIIYISRAHCHFVKTGSLITFKAHRGLEMKKWGLRMVLKQDIEVMKRGLHIVGNQGVEASVPQIQLPDYRLVTEDVRESDINSSGPNKFQLPYNWFVTEEEEKENMNAKAKENNLSNLTNFVEEEEEEKNKKEEEKKKKKKEEEENMYHADAFYDEFVEERFTA